MHVLIPIYPGLNTLDLNGPLEILGNIALPDPKPFTITIASATPLTRAFESVTIARDVDLDEAVKLVEAGQVEVLLVPGAPTAAVNEVLKSAGQGLLSLITVFLNGAPAGKKRWLISICTGALLIASVGAFDGLVATTHWAALQTLTDICKDRDKTATTKVIRKRWVDAGYGHPNVRVLSSGGISCGLDCMLYFVQETLGTQQAVDIASMMDYKWNEGIYEGFRPTFAENEDRKSGAMQLAATGWLTRQY